MSDESESTTQSIKLSDSDGDETAVLVGDIIRIESDSELAGDWWVEYISQDKITIMKNEDGSDTVITFKIQDGIIQDERIIKISILGKKDEARYAIHRGFLPETWVEIMFDGMDEPITGKITALTNDSIEIVIYENGELKMEEPIVLNFNYTGLIEGILSIENIKDPTVIIPPEEEAPPVSDSNSSDIEGEDLNINILRERDSNRFRHGIEEQTNDLLESMMSKLPPKKQMDRKVISNINKNIIKYKQLRQMFSKFDENGNIQQYQGKIEAINKHEENWKPLKHSLLNSTPSGWILPIVKNVKKIYNSEGEYDDVLQSDNAADISSINTARELFDSGDSSYTTFHKSISPELNPFVPPNNKENTFELGAKFDTNVIVGNNGISSNVYDGTMQYQTNRYVSEITYMTQVKIGDSTKETSFHTLIPENTMYISSLITLPNSFMRHSRLRLPGIDIIGRSNMATTFPMYSMSLTSNTAPSVLSINNIILEPDHTDDFSSDHFKIYLYDNVNEVINYDQFLEYFVPTTLQLISNKSQFSFTDLSVLSIINKLEPYLIYTSDITLPQYNLINDYIAQNSKVFIKTRAQYIKILEGYTKIQTPNSYGGATLITSIPQIIIEGQDFIATLIENNPTKFSIIPNKNIINSELLQQMLLLDCGKIFHTLCALSVARLISFVGEKPEEVVESQEESTCIDYIVAKKYKSLEKMQGDNGKDDIFFDREYDTTDYLFLNDPKISKKKFSVSEDEFKQFLTTELLKKMPEDTIVQTIDAMLSGHRKVLDGHYAILTEVGIMNNTLYKRVAGRWEVAPNAPSHLLNDPTFLCNSQPDCSIIDSKCKSIKQFGINAENNILSNRSNDKIELSIEDYTDAIIDELSLYDQFVRFEIPPMEYKNNYIKYLLGLDVIIHGLVSPFAKYVDLIISYPDFDRRYELIISFCSSSRICRTAKSDESPYWLYCYATNTKLIPSFFFQLAKAWMDGQYEYKIVMAEVLKERKAVDENTTTWIDKYSGYAIKVMDPATDEDYDEAGGKINSRGVLEENEGEKEQRMMEEATEPVIEIKTRADYDENGRFVYGIIDTLSVHMKIDIKNMFGFIIKTVSQLYNSGIITEKEYLKLKAKRPYADYLSEYLTYTAIGVFLIVCQSHIPILKPRGSFPGCIKSFSGFPVGNMEDKTAITYLFCIISKTKFIKISKNTDHLGPYITEIMKHNDIKSMVDKRRRFVEVVEVVEHSIFKWTSFLPALMPFKLSPPLNVPSDFVEGLIADIRSGLSIQNQKIACLQSKIILFSYAIQHEIQLLVDSEPLILKTYESKQLNENACCNDTVQMTTLDYFKTKNISNNIESYNSAILKHRDTLTCVNILTAPFMWLSSEKSKVPTTSVVSAVFSQNTVYAGFIQHCNFRTSLVNSQEITNLCGDKLQTITIADTLEEIIDKLKRAGTEYTEAQLSALLKLVSKPVAYVEINDGEVITTLDTIIALLNNLKDAEPNPAISPKFIEILLRCFTADESMIEPAIQNLKQYTYNANTHILDKLASYALTKKNAFTVQDIQTFFLDRPRTQVYFQFLKNSIINISKIFPNMCITGTRKFREKLPKYWGIASNHEKLLDSMYNRNFERVVRYYGDYGLFFKHIISSTETIINIITNIPFLDNEIGFLVLEHYLLVVLDIYTTTDENGIHSESIYEEEPEEQTVRQPQQRTIERIQSSIIRDFILTLIAHDKHINVSYQDVVDAAFRLKEKEKNVLLEKLNNTADLEVDNHFKKLRIGERWGGGENLRYYDKDRFNQETNASNKGADGGEEEEDADEDMGDANENVDEDVDNDDDDDGNDGNGGDDGDN